MASGSNFFENQQEYHKQIDKEQLLLEIIRIEPIE